MRGDGPQLRLTEIFVKACGLPKEQRAAYLERACGDDADLLREVESLLGSDRPTESLAVPQDRPSRPRLIGPYQLLEKIGEGGMGEVWLAEQSEPVRRRVALKLIKLGMDTAQVIGRFEAERQALAMMSHPNVAKVLDAATTAEGSPYFVMEYVCGISITEHCDRHRLTTRERLDLFREVCDGVQHAHHKGIIHRDLKPSNILVEYKDGESTPKIIDFGVAKATAQRLTERTVYTQLGTVIGTPEYMSPEQAEMTAQDIDTRSDVYSLGVLLYELLTGALPFDPRKLREAGFDEIRRQIREVEPVRPSTRISTLGDASAESAARRRTDVATLVRQLRGDLDWIVMRALEKDRARRYGSAQELAADVGRYLTEEPVLARPPSVGYRAGKFVRRHRLGVLATGLVAAALVFGIVGTTLGLLRANQAERTARDEADRSRALAFYVAAEAMKIEDEIDVFVKMEELAHDLDFSSWGSMLGGLSAYFRDDLDGSRRILESALARLGADPTADSSSIASTLDLLAWSEIGSARYEEASLHLKMALEIARDSEQSAPADIADLLESLALALRHLGRYDDADVALAEALELREPGQGVELATCRLLLAALRSARGEYTEAERLHAMTLSFSDDSDEDFLRAEASYWALQGDDGEALNRLARLLEEVPEWGVLNDPDYEAVRARPGFAAVIEQARSHWNKVFPPSRSPTAER